VWCVIFFGAVRAENDGTSADSLLASWKQSVENRRFIVELIRTSLPSPEGIPLRLRILEIPQGDGRRIPIVADDTLVVVPWGISKPGAAAGEPPVRTKQDRSFWKGWLEPVVVLGIVTGLVYSLYSVRSQ
jgi:hypothetical protein